VRTRNRTNGTRGADRSDFSIDQPRQRDVAPTETAPRSDHHFGDVPLTSVSSAPATAPSGDSDVRKMFGTIPGERANGVLPHAAEAVSTAARSGGQPLPAHLQNRFEQSLGADLSGVRIHTGAQAAEASHALSARAYARGNDIFFSEGQYNPHSTEGRRLLAHEVAHTVQHGGVAAGTQDLQISRPGDAGEQDAERASGAMISGRMAAVGSGPAGPMIARDFDKNMQDAGQAGGDYGAADAKVQVILGHTTVADENEAKKMIGEIDGAEEKLTRHPTKLTNKDDHGNIGPMKGMLVENHDARFVLEQYLATVSDSGDFQSEYAASYMTSKKEYGAFAGMWQAFMAAGGVLKENALQDKMSSLANDRGFADARKEAKDARNELETDKQRISEGQLGVDGAKQGLLGAVYTARSEAAGVTAQKKQKELSEVMQSINEAVDRIMLVGKIAATATTGLLAMGSGGMDMSKLVELNPEIAPPNAPPGGAPQPPSLAPPDVSKFATPGTDLNPHGTASPEDGLGKSNDTRTYQMPSQAVATSKDLATKGAEMLGGPEKMLTQAITMLEQSNINRIQAQIDAAQEDGNLNKAAASAAEMKGKKVAYEEKLRTMANTTKNLMAHKQQLDTAINAMVAVAKKRGAGKDLTGALRILGAGDKFLSQIDLTISLGGKQQQKGREATVQRYNINAGPFSAGTAQGPGQLHYWTVANEKAANDWVATKHMVELKAAGKDSLASGGPANSTQFDVGQSLKELDEWRADVTKKRDLAQNALGIGVAAGHS
jgi:hypothetical protein